MSEDLLDLTLRELLARVLAPAAQVEADPWLDPRDCPVSYRHVLAAGQAGELALHRVGRRFLVRQSELDRWIEAHRVDTTPPAKAGAEDKAPRSNVAHLLEQAGYARRT